MKVVFVINPPCPLLRSFAEALRAQVKVGKTDAFIYPFSSLHKHTLLSVCPQITRLS